MSLPTIKAVWFGYILARERMGEGGVLVFPNLYTIATMDSIIVQYVLEGGAFLYTVYKSLWSINYPMY